MFNSFLYVYQRVYLIWSGRRDKWSHRCTSAHNPPSKLILGCNSLASCKGLEWIIGGHLLSICSAFAQLLRANNKLPSIKVSVQCQCFVDCFALKDMAVEKNSNVHEKIIYTWVLRMKPNKSAIIVKVCVQIMYFKSCVKKIYINAK